MTAIRCAVSSALYRPQPFPSSHKALDPFAVDPVVIGGSLQLVGHPPAAIQRILPNHLLHVRFQLAFVCLMAAVVVGAARQVDQFTGQLYWQMQVFSHGLHRYSFSLSVKSEYLKTFFAASNCMARRPTIRSNSAIRSSSDFWLSVARIPGPHAPEIPASSVTARCL
jgi:hypothetical protein